jgi:hypothetical protein
MKTPTGVWGKLEKFFYREYKMTTHVNIVIANGNGGNH